MDSRAASVILEALEVPRAEEAERRIFGGIVFRCPEQELSYALWWAARIGELDRTCALVAARWKRRLRVLVVGRDVSVGVLARSCPHLEILEARHNARLNDRDMKDVAIACPALRVVDVRGCHLSPEGFAHLSHLRTVALSGPRLTSKVLERWSPRLLNLDVVGVAVTQASISALAASCPHLRRLVLASCDLTQIEELEFRALDQLRVDRSILGRKNLFAALGGCVALELVSARASRAILTPAPTSLPALRALDLRGWTVERGALAALLRGSPRLDSLVFADVESDDVDSDVAAIAASCPRLTLLDLSGSAVSDDAVRALVDGCAALRTLDLSETPVTDRALAYLARAGVCDIDLASCPNLTPWGLLEFLLENPVPCAVSRCEGLGLGLACLRSRRRARRRRQRHRQDEARRNLRRRLRLRLRLRLLMGDGIFVFPNTRGGAYHRDTFSDLHHLYAGPDDARLHTALVSALATALQQGHLRIAAEPTPLC